MSIPFGFRFKPSFRTLVCDYLIPKVKNQPLPCTKVFIEDRDLYSDAPWNIIKTGDPFEFDCLGDTFVKAFYLFTRVKRVSAEGTRFSRTVVDYGTWKGETGKKEVGSCRYVDGKKEKIHVGYSRLLKFKANGDGGRLRKMYGDWNMHEISLAGVALSELEGSYPLANELVVCQLKQTISKNLVCWDNKPQQQPSNSFCSTTDGRDMFTPTFSRIVRPKLIGQYVGPTQQTATHLTNGEMMWPNPDCSLQQPSNWYCAAAEGRYTSTPSFSRTLQPSSIEHNVGLTEHSALANGETMSPNPDCSSGIDSPWLVPNRPMIFYVQASQGGYAVDYVTQGAQGGFPGSFLNQTSQAGYSRFGSGNEFMSQDYMAHGSQGLFTQVGFNDPSQDDASQGHFGVPPSNPLQTQGLMNPLYSQPFTHYNTQPLNMQAAQPQQQQQQQQAPQGQGSQNQKLHYNG